MRYWEVRSPSPPLLPSPSPQVEYNDWAVWDILTADIPRATRVLVTLQSDKGGILGYCVPCVAKPGGGSAAPTPPADPAAASLTAGHAAVDFGSIEAAEPRSTSAPEPGGGASTPAEGAPALP